MTLINEGGAGVVSPCGEDRGSGAVGPPGTCSIPLEQACEVYSSLSCPQQLPWCCFAASIGVLPFGAAPNGKKRGLNGWGAKTGDALRCRGALRVFV